MHTTATGIHLTYLYSIVLCHSIMNQIDPLTVSQMGIAEVIALIPKLKPGWFSDGVRKKARQHGLKKAPAEATLLGEMSESQRMLVYLETASILGTQKQLVDILGVSGTVTSDELQGYIELLPADEREKFDGIVSKSRKLHSFFMIIIDLMLRESFKSQIPLGYASMVCKRFEVFSVRACPCCQMPYPICNPHGDIPDVVFIKLDK